MASFLFKLWPILPRRLKAWVFLNLPPQPREREALIEKIKEYR